MRSAADSKRKPSPDGVALRTVLRDAVAELTRAGVDTPQLDAELLLAQALGVQRERLIIEAPPALGPGELARFRELLARRIDREPVAYIRGSKEFRWITLRVDRRVLIPRPETELLVEVGLSLPSGSRVVDVGTGSGAVALALACERPDLEVWGTDTSAGALEVARGNAARLDLGVHFARADLLEGVSGPWDAVLANLPYVAEDSPLPPEICRYEPRVALFAGRDPLAAVRRLIPACDDVPLLALEVGVGQAEVAAELMRRRGFRVEVRQDLAGHDRVVVGSRQ